jgi:2-isopropylmalate synthase
MKEIFMEFTKYRKYPKVKNMNRDWPNKEFEKPPIWCSVDLRDGNQALEVPMNIEKKIKMFNLLLYMGIKQIEVGFPASSDTEYKFIRKLIDDNLIPDDVTIQVFTQCTEDSVFKTFESLKGAKKAIIHIYNSTSPIQREIVFNKTKEETIELAIYGAKLVEEYSRKYSKTEYMFQYSPEYFIATEIEYALEVCEAVLDIWNPTPEKKVIINLPTTVEMSTPNIFADQIEWFSKNITSRDSIILSLHTHNDRGTCIASTEMALLAGAERVEGTLFGNGERTGNLDIINLGLNLYIQGINPKLNFFNIPYVIKVYEECTKMRIHSRHPYVGKFVFTAFSGSHQDAIKKVLKHREIEGNKIWNVPYLPIDPHDIGREYTEIIRINSQSGKSGVAYILEKAYKISLNRTISIEFGKIVKKNSDYLEIELSPYEVFKLFKKTYINIDNPYRLKGYEISNELEIGITEIQLILYFNDEINNMYGSGKGEVNAVLNSLNMEDYKVCFLEQCEIEDDENVKYISYLQIGNKNNKYIGVGLSRNPVTSKIKSVISVVNKIKNLARDRSLP